jgi:hypothetical protein
MIVNEEVYDKYFIYEQYGFLAIEKVVSTSFKAIVLDKEGKQLVWNCRWDFSDTYFRYTKLPDCVSKYKPDKRIIGDYLGMAKIMLLNDNDCKEGQDYREISWRILNCFDLWFDRSVSVNPNTYQDYF